jgi:hypothetical protein
VAAPPEIEGEIRRRFGPFASVIAGETCRKNFSKCVNTRENPREGAPISLSSHRRTYAQSNGISGGLCSCSFLLIRVSQTCSQLIHMRFILVLARGLESRNSRQNRQEKKSNFIFHRAQNFLDYKSETRVVER